MALEIKSSGNDDISTAKTKTGQLIIIGGGEDKRPLA